VPRNWASFRPFSLPVIAVRVSDTTVQALADTGAAQSLIDPQLVRQLGFTTAGTQLIVGLGTTPLLVRLVTLDSVMVGRCPLHSFMAGITDLWRDCVGAGPLGPSHLRLGIQLVLGINAFRGYRLQFDLAEGRLYLLA